MANLQHLIAALGKVADAYAPYASDPNDDPDASDKDPNDDPGNDDGDPLDDPRSYSPDDDEGDKENAEDKDGDDEDDFSRPKIFSTVMLLKKLENESDLRFKTEWKARNQEIVRRNVRPPVTPLSRADQNRTQLLRLRKKTVEIDNELKLEQQVEDQFQRYVEARKRRSRKH
jgi:hypothetical protein